MAPGAHKIHRIKHFARNWLDTIVVQSYNSQLFQTIEKIVSHVFHFIFGYIYLTQKFQRFKGCLVQFINSVSRKINFSQQF